MSLGKLSGAANLGKEFEGLTPEQIKEKILSMFHVTYGRYENVSGTMAVEMCHAPDAEQSGQVHWRKYVRDETIEDEILDRESAIKRFIAVQSKGYQRTIEALTEEDLARERARAQALRSSLDREGLLTTFRKGKEYIRVREYNKGLYSIERGYGTSPTDAKHDQTEAAVRVELDFAFDEGFRKEGEEEEEGFTANPLAFFGLETPNRDEPKEPEVEEGGFNPAWLKG